MVKFLLFFFLLISPGYNGLFFVQEASSSQNFFYWKKPQPPCQLDKDCVLVDTSCCGCRGGGQSIAIHKFLKKIYNKN